MEKGVLILGNGFDLDLGLKTSYSDFMDSDDFKAIVDNNYFARYLQERRSELGGNWIDIENEIKIYLLDVCLQHLFDYYKEKSFKSEFDELVKALEKYLLNIDYSNINKNSCAAKVLKEVINHGYFSILSFNYTDLTVIYDELGFSKSAIINNKNSKDNFVKHIHGSVNESNIILGVEDETKIDNKYCYVIKSMNQYFKSSNVRGTLEDADIILFFGHSLGETDYLYFKEFFSLQSWANNQKPKEKYIRLFTEKEASRIDIMLRLREMNNKQTSLLYDLNDFRVYKTKEIDNNITEVLESLKASRIENLKEESNAKPRGIRRVN